MSLPRPDWLLNLHSDFDIIGWVGDWVVVYYTPSPTPDTTGIAWTRRAGGDWRCLIPHGPNRRPDFDIPNDVRQQALLICELFKPVP